MNQNKLPRRAKLPDDQPRETFEDVCEIVTAFYYEPPDNPDDGDPSPQSIADVAAVKVSADQYIDTYRHYVLWSSWCWGGFDKLPEEGSESDLNIRYQFSGVFELTVYLIDPERFARANNLLDASVNNKHYADELAALQTIIPE